MQQSNGLFQHFVYKTTKQQIKCNKCSKVCGSISDFRKHCIYCKLQKQLILQFLTTYKISDLNEKSVNFVLCMNPNDFFSSNKNIVDIVNKSSQYHADLLKQNPALISVKPNVLQHASVPCVPTTSFLKKEMTPVKKSVKISQKMRRVSQTDFADNEEPAPKKLKMTNYEPKPNRVSKKKMKISQTSDISTISDSPVHVPCNDSFENDWDNRGSMQEIDDVEMEGNHFGFTAIDSDEEPEQELTFCPQIAPVSHPLKIPSLKEMRLDTVFDVIPSEAIQTSHESLPQNFVSFEDQGVAISGNHFPVETMSVQAVANQPISPRQQDFEVILQKCQPQQPKPQQLQNLQVVVANSHPTSPIPSSKRNIFQLFKDLPHVIEEEAIFGQSEMTEDECKETKKKIHKILQKIEELSEYLGERMKEKERKLKKNRKGLPSFSYKHVVGQVDLIVSFLVHRLTTTEEERATIRMFGDENVRFSENQKPAHLKKKLASTLLVASQIQQMRNIQSSMDIRKAMTVVLSSQNLNSKGVSALSGMGITTTTPIYNLFSSDQLINWVHKSFQREIADLREGNFFISYDNLYFKMLSAYVGAKIGKFQKMKMSQDCNSSALTKYLLKTVTSLIIFLPKDTEITIDDDFLEDIYAATQQQNNSFIKFVNSLLNESKKAKGSLNFYKEEAKSGEPARIFVVDSAFQGDDSKQEHKTIMKHIFSQIKQKFGVDIENTSALANVDGKGYPLRKSLETDADFKQKTVFGDMHMVLNLLVAYLALFYDSSVKILAKSLNITKSIKDIVAKELKKVRQIVATIAVSSFKRLQSYFPEIVSADGLMLKSFEVLKQERQSYQQSFQNSVDAVNFKEELEKLKKLKTIGKIRISMVELKDVAKSISLPEISALYIQENLKKKNLVPLFPTTDEFLEKQSAEALRVLCCLKVCMKKNRGATVEEMRAWIKDSTSTYEMDQRKREILTLFTLAWCGSMCYGYHVAMRTKNWHLKLFIIKKSIGMFEDSGKTTYLKMCDDFLKDLKSNFSEKEKNLLKKMWVVPAATTNSFVGLDELTEFVNGFLKNHVKTVSKKNILFFSGYHAFIKDIDQSYMNFLGGVENMEEDDYKSTEVLSEDLANLETVPVSSILIDECTIFNVFADFKEIL